MKTQFVTITRSKSTMKPRVIDDDLPFFMEAKSSRVLLGLSNNKPATFSDNWRSKVNVLPYLAFKDEEVVRGNPCDYLESGRMDYFQLDYQFVGGFNNNALKVFWEIKDHKVKVIWVAVKTFTGAQIKYVMPESKQELLFAFAEEDAYCYCDYSPCQECVFRCKHGFVIYVFLNNEALVRMSCNRMDEEYIKF